MNIHFLLCQCNHVLRTSHNAQLASFAAVRIDNDGTFHLAHINYYVLLFFSFFGDAGIPVFRFGISAFCFP